MGYEDRLDELERLSGQTQPGVVLGVEEVDPQDDQTQYLTLLAIGLAVGFLIGTFLS